MGNSGVVLLLHSVSGIAFPLTRRRTELLTDPLCGGGLYTAEHMRIWRFGGGGIVSCRRLQSLEMRDLGFVRTAQKTPRLR
jgi:hypothetical protein